MIEPEPIQFRVPHGTDIYGEMFSVIGDGEWLDQDILQVRLASGFGVDVGWYPALDPNGSFGVVAYQNSNFNDQIRPMFRTPDPEQAAMRVQHWIDELSGETK